MFKLKSLLIIMLLVLTGAMMAQTSLAEVAADENGDAIPDNLGEVYTVTAMVTSPCYQGTNRTQYYMQDLTGGVMLFFYNAYVELLPGDIVTVTGEVQHFNGATELVPASETDIEVLSTGNTVGAPVVLTIAEYLADAERFENMLIAFQNVSLVSGEEWPTGTSSANLLIEDASGQTTLRIDSDMDILGNNEPTWPADVVGCAGQYDSSDPYDEGYQILPRFYTDFQAAGSVEGLMPLDYVTMDMNNDAIPDNLGSVYTAVGIITSPCYQGTTRTQYYMQDATSGVMLFNYNNYVELEVGDLVQVKGEVQQFNGATELVPAEVSDITVLAKGLPTPEPYEVTIAEYLANGEALENMIIAIKSVSLVSGEEWPTGTSSANILITDGTGELTLRIDSDMDILGNVEPSWPVDLLGAAGQYDNTDPYDEGYQILPRYYADFLPEGTVPVELTSFAATAVNGVVTLSWTTATELNNKGFEIERKTDAEFETVGFVSGNATTSEVSYYSFSDNVNSGSVVYRLRQVDFDGSYEYSSEIEVVLAPASLELAQNYPNPFNPSTTISYTVPENGNVVVKVFDVLGKEVATLVNENTEAGFYNVQFDASNLTSGVYFYSINFGGQVLTNKMMLLK